VEVVPLDLLADPPAGGDADAELRELRLHPRRLLVGPEHDGDRADPLALGLKHFLPWTLSAQGFDQFEVDVADHYLCPPDLEVGNGLPVHLAVMDPGAVRAEDPPRSPAECLVIGPHLRLEIADDDRHLA